ncbi:response regulator transcription factor [Candidatus Uhrbacteria bacterium]|nr:response regulator transcription factor [Candidatus Uhrbacteria bacterium]
MALIWAVDDDQDLTALYHELLGEAGHTVRTANDPCVVPGWMGAGAHPDLMILDYHMPGMNGLELAGIVRHAGYTGPIVMVSSSRTITVVPLFVTAVVRKPFESDEFLDRVTMLLPQKAQAHAAL